MFYDLMFKFCNQTDLSVIFEAINGIIDLFSEDDHNQVLKDSKFIQTFKP